MSDTPEQQYSPALDYTAAYKVILRHFYWFRFSSNEPNIQKYTIFRKMPMLVTRQERNLAIDGVYIHVRSLSCVLHVTFVLTIPTNARSCPPIKPKPSSIARKQLPTISRASPTFSNQRRRHPYSSLSSLAGRRIRGTTLKLRAQGSPVSFLFSFVVENIISSGHFP